MQFSSSSSRSRSLLCAKEDYKGARARFIAACQWTWSQLCEVDVDDDAEYDDDDDVEGGGSGWVSLHWKKIVKGRELKKCWVEQKVEREQKGNFVNKAI